MGRVIHFKSHTRLRKGAAKLRSLDYAEHNRFSNIVENEIGIFLQAALTTVGNILPLNAMLEDHGSLARTSGNYATIIGHNHDKGKVAIRSKKSSEFICSRNCWHCGRVDKTMLKAGRAYHRYRVKRNSWPKTRGVAMNLVDHPRGGGNHQHISNASNVSREVGLIAARKSGTNRVKNA
nr:4303_t:CDS:2 [Entrophospora candida]